MTIRYNTILAILGGCSLTGGLLGQVGNHREVPLRNWPAPLYWQPTAAEAEAGRMQPEVRDPSPKATLPANSLVFIAITPCRVVDTRTSQMFANPFGPPALVANATRSFPVQSGVCSIPAIAQAYSLNVTVIPPAGVGYLKIWPTGVSEPNAVTLDDITGDIRNNAAIVPAGTPNGSLDVKTNAVTDLVIDINGYYAPASGITLAQGTAAAPSLSFAGDAGTGIFSLGAGSFSLSTGGSPALTVASNGDIWLTGAIRKGGNLFLHDFGGFTAAFGLGALAVNNGSGNTASGYGALTSNTIGGHNTAHGFNTLQNNTQGSNNTAVGNLALQNNTAASFNTGIGSFALNNNTGSSNTALGYNAGSAITTGTDNIEIGNIGTSADTGVVRIGASGTHTSFFAAGIAGVMVSGTPVLVDGMSGQLGTMSSSRRYKEDIQDMDDASSGLLRLRPVTFRYQKSYSDGSKPIDYGLIAEEVAEVYPDLVVKGADGQIQTVQYQKLTPMLLNELQKLQTQVASLRKEHQTMESLQAQVAAMQKALDAISAGQAVTQR